MSNGYGGPPLSLWQRLRRMMGFPNNQGTSSSWQSGSRNTSNSFSDDTDWDQSSQYVNSGSGENNPIPVPSSDSYRIDEMASRLDRVADRYENAGDTARAEAMHAAAEQMRESGSYADAQAIESSLESGSASDGNYNGDASGSGDSATSDWSGSDFSDNS